MPVVLALLILVGCGEKDPVRNLSRDLERYPEYSLMVDDTRIEGSLFPDYALLFQVLTASGRREAGRDSILYEERKTDWYPVSEDIFYRYENYVGMVIASKSMDGQRTGANQAHPAGYQYVGNSHYGSWGGGGFWQFYGQYAMMSHMMGGWRVGRGDYQDYRRTRERGSPYYGPVKGGRPTFGARGTVTEKTRPQFYQRKQNRRQAFSGQAKNRMGRATSGWGRGSSRTGK
ncbi:MAG TPA: hypothetical protein EYG11_21000 [Candidatus Latescibacteria bacterium]|nr:hypothetical protein [Candidatus Latescibacterota bacterium]